jgi:multicomponent K+:H+ antiporter subunit E
MRRWVPHPAVAVVLFVIWLLLTQSFSPGQILLGGMVAVAGTHALAALRPGQFEARSARAALKLAVIVAVDIVRSNFAVAAIVLIPRKKRVSNFVRLPLDLTDRNGLAILALIITATPGTMWVEFDGRRSMLLVHVLDLVDETEWVRLIKGRYETLLLEIFGR